MTSRSSSNLKTTIYAANFLLLLGIAVRLYHLPFEPARGREQFDEGGPEFIRGDANDDGMVDVSDAVYCINYVFINGDQPSCLAAADADDNGEIDLIDAIVILHYQFLGGAPPAPPFPEAGPDPTPDLGCREPSIPPLPEVGSLGGPDRVLTEAEALSWRRGRDLFDRPTMISEGLGPIFNGDSCRGCHLDPVLGGAGGLDLNVVRFAFVDGTGTVSQLEGGPVASRLSIPSVRRDEMHADANVVETRQPPTCLGLGLVDRIPDAVLLQNADPDDDDQDGISGRARMVNGRVGRFGHKAGVPTLTDFTADALLNELGLTVNLIHSLFAADMDADTVPDPEISDQEFLDLAFFLAHLAPPPRILPPDPVSLDRINAGEVIFGDIGCASCHLPVLDGADGPVRAYSDFLLHDVADPARYNVNEPGVAPGEFRTAPFLGLRNTAPYLHDGSAETLGEAVLLGHHGEATAARNAYAILPLVQKSQLQAFLLSL
jgi:hypothetical protein